MTYHTFELSCKLTIHEYESITKYLKNAGDKFYTDKDEYVPTKVSTALRDYGIIIRIRCFYKNDYHHYVLYYQINPRRVMEKNNYIGLFKAGDTEKMLKKVNQHLHGINKAMPDTDMCKLSRIDFCTNIEMSGQKEISEYIGLLQRGFYPMGYVPELFYDLIGKRDKFPKNSFNVCRKKLVKITYYNKFDQLKENKHCRNIKDAENILRAEIQCDKRKVRHLSKKFDCENVRDFLERSDEIGTYVFMKYANKCCGTGDFYKIDEIYRKIDDSRYKEKSKVMMREFIRLSATHKSVQTAIREMHLRGDKIKAILKKFDELGVSPIVIPMRRKYDTLKNPLTLALESCKYCK